MQQVYVFDKKGYFIGEDFDYGTGLPNNSTYEAPPEFQDGFIPHWNGVEWIQAENHKGKTVWQKGEGEKWQEKKWKEYGALPDNVSLTQPPKTLAEAKEAKKQAINQARDSKEQAGFIYDGSPFDTNQISYMRLLGASQTAQTALAAGQAFSVEWTLADNSSRTMSAEDMIGIIPAFAMYSSTLHAKASELKAQVDAVAIVKGTAASLAKREAAAVAIVDAISIEFSV